MKSGTAGLTAAASTGVAAVIALLAASLSSPSSAQGLAPESPLGEFFADQPVELIDDEDLGQGSYILPLGAMKKLKGSWRPEEVERLRAGKRRLTWRVVEGFSSSDVVGDLEAHLLESGAVELLYSCDARACGNGSQWASRIFEERLLYGRAESQRYRAWRIERDGGDLRALVYASARSADRQYLRVELFFPDS